MGGVEHYPVLLYDIKTSYYKYLETGIWLLSDGINDDAVGLIGFNVVEPL